MFLDYLGTSSYASTTNYPYYPKIIFSQVIFENYDSFLINNSKISLIFGVF